jgi:hypothetical protein
VQKKTIFITEIISSVFLSDIGVREITENKSQVEYFFFGNGNFPIGSEIGKYPAILAKNVIHISHEIIVVTVQPVIVTVSTLIGAIFFISSSIQGFSAIVTIAFHRGE